MLVPEIPWGFAAMKSRNWGRNQPDGRFCEGFQDSILKTDNGEFDELNFPLLWNALTMVENLILLDNNTIWH